MGEHGLPRPFESFDSSPHLSRRPVQHSDRTFHQGKPRPAIRREANIQQVFLEGNFRKGLLRLRVDAMNGVACDHRENSAAVQELKPLPPAAILSTTAKVFVSTIVTSLVWLFST